MQFSLLGAYYFEEISSSYVLGFIHQLTPRSKELKNHDFIYPHQTLRFMEGEGRGTVISHLAGEENGGDQRPDFLHGGRPRNPSVHSLGEPFSWLH